MKILFVQDSLGTGGAERSNAELWYFLKKNNWQIKIAVLEHRTIGIEKEILDQGFDVHFLEGSFYSQVNGIIKLITQFEPDIVNSVLLRSSIRVRIAKKFTPFYHVESLVNCSYSDIRFNDPQTNKTGLKFSQYINMFTQKFGTDAFIAITNEVKSHAVEKLRINEKKISVIQRGRSENKYIQENNKAEAQRSLRRELNLKSSTIIFAHVGRQEYQKGHLNLLKAIAEVQESLSKLEVQFLFCGREGNETNKIQQFLKTHQNINQNLHWLGHRNDIQRILAGSDVFIFPSLYEGLGGALIEAQAAGLPIICSDIKVFEEVISSDNAVTFKVDDSNDLALKIIEMAQSFKKREEMGENSLCNFYRKFNIEGVHQKMITYYNSIKF